MPKIITLEDIDNGTYEIKGVSKSDLFEAYFGIVSEYYLGGFKIYKRPYKSVFVLRGCHDTYELSYYKKLSDELDALVALKQNLAILDRCKLFNERDGEQK